MSALKRVIFHLSLLAAPAVALAAPSIPKPVGEGETLTLARVVLLIEETINIFLGVSTTIVVAMIVYGGILMATARENAKQWENGKQTLRNAIWGLIVVLGVGIIVRTIGDFAVSPTSILR